MIERVASAMAGWSHDDYEADAEAWNEMARVAIAAMREPTMGMVKSAYFASDSYVCWQRMIDEASL